MSPTQQPWATRGPRTPTEASTGPVTAAPKSSVCSRPARRTTHRRQLRRHGEPVVRVVDLLHHLHRAAQLAEEIHQARAADPPRRLLPDDPDLWLHAACIAGNTSGEVEAHLGIYLDILNKVLSFQSIEFKVDDDDTLKLINGLFRHIHMKYYNAD